MGPGEESGNRYGLIVCCLRNVAGSSPGKAGGLRKFQVPSILQVTPISLCHHIPWDKLHPLRDSRPKKSNRSLPGAEEEGGWKGPTNPSLSPTHPGSSFNQTHSAFICILLRVSLYNSV